MSAAQKIEALGFTRVKDFQAGWNLGAALSVDGIIGPKTTSAADTSYARKMGGDHDISLTFSAHQFACHCGGRLTGCHKTLLLRPLLQSLEEAVRAYGDVPGIVDGYRCPSHNASVGGAKDSMHLYGAACDPSWNLVQAEILRLNTFSGIGSKESGSHRVTHVDRRDVVDAHNLTHGTRRHPTLWYYPG